MISVRGVKMGRPGRIVISQKTAGGNLRRVRVGGEAVQVSEGKLSC